LTVLSGRRRAALIAPLAMILVLSLAAPAATAAGDPPGLARFMSAIAKVESGGRYRALNATSGAYGRYQIMPASWQAWAGRYLGSAAAPRTAANQEKVARAKIVRLYRWLGSWKRVAYWWLTGSSRTTGWSSPARAYVAKVMHYYSTGTSRHRGGSLAKAADAWHVAEISRSIHYAGRWASAGHGGYVGGKVRYSTQAGASATLAFTGSRVLWYGPVGPTRGQARVSIDGTYVRTVDLHRSGFRARALLYSASWSTAGRHTLTIEVVGTKGHPLVAIDELIVKR
jgi:hypothetical protein